MSRITIEAYQRFANEAKSIEVSKSEDGKGLSTGADIDYHLVNGFLPDELGGDFERYQRGEADVKISGEPAIYIAWDEKDQIVLWRKKLDLLLSLEAALHKLQTGGEEHEAYEANKLRL